MSKGKYRTFNAEGQWNGVGLLIMVPLVLVGGPLLLVAVEMGIIWCILWAIGKMFF